MAADFVGWYFAHYGNFFLNYLRIRSSDSTSHNLAMLDCGLAAHRKPRAVPPLSPCLCPQPVCERRSSAPAARPSIHLFYINKVLVISCYLHIYQQWSDIWCGGFTKPNENNFQKNNMGRKFIRCNTRKI